MKEPTLNEAILGILLGMRTPEYMNVVAKTHATLLQARQDASTPPPPKGANG